MQTLSLRHLLAVLVALAMLAAASVPALADDDDDDDDLDAEAETELMEVEVNPSIADVGEVVQLEVELEDDADESDDGDESDDDDSEDESDEKSDAGDQDAVDGDEDDEQVDAAATEQPATDQPAADQPATDQPATEQPAVDRSVTSVVVEWGDGEQDVLLGDQPADQPAGDQPAADEPRADQPADEAVVVDPADDDDENSDDEDSDEDDDDSDDEDELEAEHAYDAAGEFVVTVTATRGDGSTDVAEVLVQVGGGEARLSGDSRHETAIEVSEEEFDDGEAAAVLLARADAFADALAAAPLAHAEDAPILLTDTAAVPQAVLDEVDRVLADGGTVYLLGGEGAIDPAVEVALADLGYVVVRVAGTDRVDTALQIARFLIDAGVEVDEVVLAAAGSFPDALSGAAYAAREGAPILLTGADALDPRVRDLLVELGDVDVLVPGGTGVVAEAVVTEVEALGLDVERIAGDDRFATSAAIAEARFDDIDTIIVATGRDFPDALAAGAQGGRAGAPILLVGDTLPDDVAAFIAAHADEIETVYVLGGPNAVSDAVVDAIEALLADD